MKKPKNYWLILVMDHDPENIGKAVEILNAERIANLYANHPRFARLVECTGRNPGTRISLTGLHGSSKSLVCGQLIRQSGGAHLIILPGKEEAAYFFNDLSVPGKDGIIFFLPSSFKRTGRYRETDSSNIILRTEILAGLHSGERNMTIVTYPEALTELVVSREKFRKIALRFGKGEKISIEQVQQLLGEQGFEQSDFVFEPGQFSIRGSIVDIFSFSNDHPYRMDFFGNELESLRSFDVESQLSVEQHDEIVIIPDIHRFGGDYRDSFLHCLPETTLIWSEDFRYLEETVNELYARASFEEAEYPDGKESLLITGTGLMGHIRAFTTVEIGPNHYFRPDHIVEFNTSPQPVFNKNFELLGRNLRENSSLGYANLILSGSRSQIDRLGAIFDELNHSIRFSPVLVVLHQGFIDHDLKVCCYTDHQIFERYHKFRLRGNFAKSEALTVKELNSLVPGDYVVHIDHGIGQFGGLEKMEINGKFQEAVKLVYRDNDILFVRLHALHRIARYKGKDGTPPRINKLGSGAWNRLKQSTKKRVKDIARELIALYAERKAQKGFTFSPDTYLQDELEASFIYEDTPDQQSATHAVKEGMESPYPMDRLVCGDVGFGKTEVAVRAAFKAVADSKQVALLVPTTILVLQHYNTFLERLSDFPCNIDYISRLKKLPAQKKSLKELADGKTDIIIGTHRLLGRDVVFKDIGLLIIDEEQKFGVAAKEKIRQLRISVDTLTLTATPIPRTLQFSLMGARDLSIISTPPPNRHPIVTELHPFSEELIREGIEYEVSRNGQVFFIHNRVDSIGEIEGIINRLCPSVKTAVAHGQLEGKRLENIMLDFIGGKYDVLVATSIIESGLDIPNANTIFIHNAHHFGLSDLHQLRGRVGRSNKKAFCYLLVPPLATVTPEARRRLKAIEEFSDVGSGFNIAMQDLDIRGAGNLLGGEQSGFIADIGFETYHRILDEAVRELKEEEFRTFFLREEHEEESSRRVREELGKIQFVRDCMIDTDLELMFPDEYISSIPERLRLYRELDNIRDETTLKSFEKQLTDRFGLLPPQAGDLLNLVRLRWIAIRLGFEKIVIRDDRMILYFITDQTSPYYKSPVFSSIIQYLQDKPDRFRMKETRGKLTLTTDTVQSIREATEILNRMNGFFNPGNNP